LQHSENVFCYLPLDVGFLTGDYLKEKINPVLDIQFGFKGYAAFISLQFLSNSFAGVFRGFCGF